jgi:hypothetical protein
MFLYRSASDGSENIARFFPAHTDGIASVGPTRTIARELASIEAALAAKERT